MRLLRSGSLAQSSSAMDDLSSTPCRRRRSTQAASNLLKAALLATLVPSAASAASIKLCDPQGHCQVSRTPAKFCVTDDVQPRLLLRPFLRSRFHLQLDPPVANQAAPSVMVTEPRRPLCRLLDFLLTKSGLQFWNFCKDCSEEKCARAMVPLSAAGEYGVDFAPRGGCLYLQDLPERVALANAYWELSWDRDVPLQGLAGIALNYFAEPLSESRLVHGTLGGGFSLMFMSALAMLWCVREVRRTMGSFSGGVTGMAAVSLLSVAAPSFWTMLATTLMPYSGSLFSVVVSLKDPFYGFPVGILIIVQMVVLVLAAVLWGASSGLRYFASAPDPEGEVDFTIGMDGRRLDDLPTIPIPQRLLKRSMWLGGVALLATCSYSDAFSVTLLLIALISPRVLYYVQLAIMAREAKEAGSFRNLVSKDAYQQQSQMHTEAALASLREHVKNHPELLGRFEDATELKLRRFTEHGQHHRAAPAAEGPPVQMQTQGWCCLM
eukprot:TRINITY_DN80848_c0_g1_i1.p1 TRINITY_DN80848_c0_g1~~TRINITY_DN80848_c0_g1_i1.p1  ORF type:complete len:493 (-),score=76.07 TRINITY_DN80848_c0_g1_i1:32-1510(-)